MLFLAVFCGFLAENKREHMVEHQREKQFMRSLVEDLETDTTELKKGMERADTVALYSDSVLIFLASYKPAATVPVRLADYIGRAGQRQTLINTDRTSSQLKNSGAMRLIRKKNVTDLILRYWKQINESNISLDRYMLYRNSSREIVFKLWVIPDVYEASRLMKKDSIRELRVIETDTKKWDELANLIAINRSISRNAHLMNLEKQLTLARDLIVLIKKEYRLK